MQTIFSTVKRPEVRGPNVYAKHLLKNCLDSNSPNWYSVFVITMVWQLHFWSAEKPSREANP